MWPLKHGFKTHLKFLGRKYAGPIVKDGNLTVTRLRIDWATQRNAKHYRQGQDCRFHFGINAYHLNAIFILMLIFRIDASYFLVRCRTKLCIPGLNETGAENYD